MSMLVTEVFRIITSADAECVWDALTATKRPIGYLYGMTLESDWQAGSTVTLGPPGGSHLTGDILVADRPRRLSYTLGDRPSETSVYVTWEIRSEPAGTVVRLYADEPHPEIDATEALEVAWLPVLSRLVAHLDRCAPGPNPAVGA